MVAARRPASNFALQRAAETAAGLNRPLLVLEALRCDYPWASDRLHHFVLDGMADNAAAFSDRPVLYYPYVEQAPGAGRGLIAALGAHACAIVTDRYPAFFIPRMTAAAASQVAVRMEAVDSNGLIPVAEHGRAFPTARGYRAFMQRVLNDHVREVPDADPLEALTSAPPMRRLPGDVAIRWPAASRRCSLATARPSQPSPSTTRSPRRRCAGVLRRGDARFVSSWSSVWSGTARTIVIPISRAPAGCPRTCISAISRRTKFLARS